MKLHRFLVFLNFLLSFLSPPSTFCFLSFYRILPILILTPLFIFFSNCFCMCCYFCTYYKMMHNLFFSYTALPCPPSSSSSPLDSSSPPSCSVQVGEARRKGGRKGGRDGGKGKEGTQEISVTRHGFNRGYRCG